MQELKDSKWWKLWKIPGIIHTVTATPKVHNSTCLNTKSYNIFQGMLFTQKYVLHVTSLLTVKQTVEQICHSILRIINYNQNQSGLHFFRLLPIKQANTVITILGLTSTRSSGSAYTLAPILRAIEIAYLRTKERKKFSVHFVSDQQFVD